MVFQAPGSLTLLLLDSILDDESLPLISGKDGKLIGPGKQTFFRAGWRLRDMMKRRRPNGNCQKGLSVRWIDHCSGPPAVRCASGVTTFASNI